MSESTWYLKNVWGEYWGPFGWVVERVEADEFYSSKAAWAFLKEAKESECAHQWSDASVVRVTHSRIW